MADINSNLPTKDTSDGSPGSAVPSIAIQVAGSDGTNLRTLSTDTTGKVNINNISGTITLPTGAATSAIQTNGTQTTEINNGATTMAVKAASTAAVAADPAAVVSLSPNSPLVNFPSLVDTNYGTVGASTIRGAAQIGNATGAALFGSGTTTAQVLRAVLPTDQTGINTFLDKSGTGTISALNGTVVATTNGASTVLFNITGTWVATLLFEGQDGNGNWLPALGTVPGNGSPTASTGTNLALAVPCGGFNQVRVRASAYTSGTVTVTFNVGAGVNSLQVFNLTASGFAATVSQPTASSLNAQVVGNIASGSADSGNPVKIGGVFNSTLPSLSTGQRVDRQTDLNGRDLVANAPLDGYKASYSAATTGLVAATTPTDIFTITGSATKTVRVTQITFSGTQNTSASRDILIIKRSSANTGGTSTTLTNVPHDSGNSAATATVRAYTANPSALGTAVGTIRSRRIQLLATNVTNPLDSIVWDFGIRPSQAIVLRGTGDVLAINLNSVSSTNNILELSVEWTEE